MKNVFLICVVATLALASAEVPKIKAKRDYSLRIIGGDTARAGQFPSAAAIYVTTASGTYFCGGSLISQQFVLTSANCISGGVQFQVVLGSTTLQGTDPNRQILSTSTSILHPDYNSTTLENDVALIQFHAPIEYTDHIQRVYLPTVDLINNLGITAIGWGQTSDETAGVSNDLQYVSVATIPNDECQNSYASTIFDSMVCVSGNYNEGSCRGDLGSPIMTTLNHHHWHVGIASFISSNGCESSDPSGYTRTFTYVEWIKTTAGL